MSTEDRRAPGASRIPFEGLVEVGGAMGPAFEAQAVNLSEDGMLLRTAYLPEAGQPLTCRFDAGGGQSVLAAGEVVWAQGAEKGGEFAIRFTDMDPESIDALKRACGVGQEPAPAVQAGSKVRLHIEGLASPMRAKIKDAHASEITVGSDLGFLQVGRQLELEDAQSGDKRPASIDRVEVAVDPASNVPQLVVTLRYADAQGAADAQRAAPVPGPRRAEPAPAPPRSPSGEESIDEESIRMKGAVARNIARIGPALERFATLAKTTVALLAARRGVRDDDPAAPRRTTAPAPGGGLHTSGRRVVRGEPEGASEETSPRSPLPITKRRAVIAGGVMIAAVLGAILLKRSHHDGASEATAASAAAAHELPAATAATAAPLASAPAPASSAPPLDTGSSLGGFPPPAGGLASVDDGMDTSAPGSHKHHGQGRVAPFGNGPVHHGNVLHLKMDGLIEAIEGAQQPTGFAIKLPGRKSLEAAGPLAARDARIAAIKVSNDPAGAELTVAFKDGVPNYLVSAKGDTLHIALSPVGAVVAKKEASGKHHHHKHEHKKDETH